MKNTNFSDIKKKIKYFKYYSKILLNNWIQIKDSYAQHGEDILVESLLPNGVESFIDIGANDGVLFSNTYKFAKRGAKGICVEPSKSSFQKLKLNHLFHPKVKCIQSAISNVNGSIYINECGYESTLSHVSDVKTTNSYRVNCQTLSKILCKFSEFLEVDFMSVDVEGHEKEIFEGLTEDSFRTKIIIIESDKTEISKLIAKNSLKHYKPIYTNGINHILVNKDIKFPILKTLPKGFKKC
jgi:FkbM family methyltransferase